MDRKSLGAVGTGGLLTAALLGSLVSAAPQAAAADPACQAGEFKREFFATTSFSGTPVKTDCDGVVNQNWSGSPIAGMPADNFGVRWTIRRDFGSGGPFTLSVCATDGVRVSMDGVRRIDLWKSTGDTARCKSVDLTVAAGTHSIRLAYANWTGAAKVRFSYTPRTSPTVDKTRPFMPTAVNARYDAATRNTSLTWLPNAEMDLAHYALYRRPVGVHTWTKVATTTATQATDPLVNTRTPYYYEVRAVDKAGNSSGGLDVLVRPLPVVQWVTGTYDEATGQVHLKWGQNHEPQFDHYTVLSYEKVDGRDTWVTLGRTTTSNWTTAHIPRDGRTVHYRILVTNDAGATTHSPAQPDPTAGNEVQLTVPDAAGGH